MKIKPEQLDEVIRELLVEETERTEKAIDLAVKATKRKSLKMAKDRSPRSGRNIKSGRKPYADSWSSTTDKGRVRQHVTIYNKHYRLTHLLENGHFIFNKYGGAFGRTKSQSHIAPTQEETNEMFEEELINRL